MNTRFYFDLAKTFNDPSILPENMYDFLDNDTKEKEYINNIRNYTNREAHKEKLNGIIGIYRTVLTNNENPTNELIGYNIIYGKNVTYNKNTQEFENTQTYETRPENQLRLISSPKNEIEKEYCLLRDAYIQTTGDNKKIYLLYFENGILIYLYKKPGEKSIYEPKIKNGDFCFIQDALVKNTIEYNYNKKEDVEILQNFISYNFNNQKKYNALDFLFTKKTFIFDKKGRLLERTLGEKEIIFNPNSLHTEKIQFKDSPKIINKNTNNKEILKMVNTTLTKPFIKNGNNENEQEYYLEVEPSRYFFLYFGLFQTNKGLIDLFDVLTPEEKEILINGISIKINTIQQTLNNSVDKIFLGDRTKGTEHIKNYLANYNITVENEEKFLNPNNVFNKETLEQKYGKVNYPYNPIVIILKPKIIENTSVLDPLYELLTNKENIVVVFSNEVKQLFKNKGKIVIQVV